MNDSTEQDSTPPEDFDEHVDYLSGLVVKATPEDENLRQQIFGAIEELVGKVDGREWSGCLVAWTDEIPDSPEDWTGEPT